MLIEITATDKHASLLSFHIATKLYHQNLYVTRNPVGFSPPSQPGLCGSRFCLVPAINEAEDRYHQQMSQQRHTACSSCTISACNLTITLIKFESAICRNQETQLWYNNLFSTIIVIKKRVANMFKK
jgi:hypothetical protein